MVGLPLATWQRLAVWLAVGLAIYLGFGRKRAERMRAGARVSAASLAE
jgi:APA family basic amino acid/polyamine antiporter